MSLPRVSTAAKVYEDSHVYACLASYPIARGHTIVAWKRPVRDLHLLSCAELEHLMDVVDLVRDALLELLTIEKVYLLYMDEVKHVHWHLVPRWNDRGMHAFARAPKHVRSFPLAPRLRDQIAMTLRAHPELRN